ncbi:NUDIX hydrolase [Piscinibacter sakaiensis]|uniref:NUDIX hydrolase n=1 Tax=Piscinibacter sakaiensis TaxID=1547922 RepID=UPI003AB078D1
MTTPLPPPTIAVPAIAATVVLLRDGIEGMEVLLVVRHHAIDFASGAAVFPGGKVAVSDRDPRLLPRICGMAGLQDEQVAIRVAAIRETYEESGLLLARQDGDQSLLGSPRLGAVHERWKEAIASGGGAFVDMVCEEGLQIAGDVLQPFAHWVTPEHSPKRFDTHFFIAAAPVEQLARHDGFEAVDSFWIRPLDALRECEQRRRTLIFPTLSNLALLAQSADVTSAIDAARQRPACRIQPWLVERPNGKRVPMLPPEARYPTLSDALMDQIAR